MIQRRSGAIALVWWLVSVAVAIAAVLISSTKDPSFVLLFLPFTTIGAVLAWRRPENPVAWLLQLAGFLMVLSGFNVSYAREGLVHAPGSLPAAMTVAWVNSWAFPLLFGALTALFLLFPNGYLLSRRWRVVLWAQWVLVAIMSVGSAFFSTGFYGSNMPGYRNPYLIVPVPGLLSVAPALMLPAVAAALSLILRARRARGVERQQLKWVGYAVALFTLTAGGVWLAMGLSSTESSNRTTRSVTC